MAHIYHCTKWQVGRKWYCNDVEDLAGVAGKWWTPARMLGMSLTDYIIMLKDTFHANIIKYYEDTDVLIFNWDKYEDMNKYLLWINAKARKANFMV